MVSFLIKNASKIYDFFVQMIKLIAIFWSIISKICNFESKMIKNRTFLVENGKKNWHFFVKNGHFLLKNDLRPTSNSLSSALRPPPTALRPTCDPPHFSLATHPHFRLRPATEPPQIGGVLGGYCPRVSSHSTFFVWAPIECATDLLESSEWIAFYGTSKLWKL